MKTIKTLLLVLAIPALSASVYAGGCCKGDSSKDKNTEKEKTSVVQVESTCTGGSCDGSKGKDKDKA